MENYDIEKILDTKAYYKTSRNVELEFNANYAFRFMKVEGE